MLSLDASSMQDVIGPTTRGGQMVARVKLGCSSSRNFHAAFSAKTLLPGEMLLRKLEIRIKDCTNLCSRCGRLSEQSRS